MKLLITFVFCLVLFFISQLQLLRVLTPMPYADLANLLRSIKKTVGRWCQLCRNLAQDSGRMPPELWGRAVIRKKFDKNQLQPLEFLGWDAHVRGAKLSGTQTG